MLFHMNTKRTLGGLAGLGLLVGCLNTTGTESSGSPTALRGADSADGEGGTGKGGRKEYVCHIPPGNPANAHTIRIGYPAVDAHLAHGDSLGRCPDVGGSGSRKPCGEGRGHGKRITKDSESAGFKVTLCHIPPGDAAAAHTITVGPAAVKAHLAHGDVLGSCEDDSEGSLSYVEADDCVDGPDGEGGSGGSNGGSGEGGSKGGSGEGGSGTGTGTGTGSDTGTSTDTPVGTGT